jgi:uncharacterized repeat protein (TIGR02543 family)
VPNNGYDFTGWTGGYTGSANPLTITNVTSDMTITANFAKHIYTVTFVAGANGDISGIKVQKVAYQGNCTAVTAVPNTGYDFVGWTGGYNTTNPLTITNVTSDIAITAQFAIHYYTLTLVPSISGCGGCTSCTPSTNIYGPATVAYATDATVSTQQPGACGYTAWHDPPGLCIGYSCSRTFNRWVVSSGTATIVSPTSLSTVVRLYSDATITAVFQ